MKKSLIALAVLAAAGVAHAQSNVTIYGQIDLGLSKSTGTTTSMLAGDNNKLGFKGVEDLGGGLKAIFQAEMRFDGDTGTTEAGGNRPLFQGQSRVGLQGDFGMVRLGRGLTAVQEMAGQFEPWSEDRNRAAMTSYIIANYNSDPLNAGSSQNRWSNAIWYNTPNTPAMGGFSFAATLATKEALGAGTPTANPYSLAGNYAQGPVSVMLGYERNAVETKFWNIGASFMATPELKLMAHYSRQNYSATAKTLSATLAVTPATVPPSTITYTTTPTKTSAWLIGANYALPTGTLIAGYGQITPDATEKTKRFAVGYEHTLSKRTFLYVDAYNEKRGNLVWPFGAGGSTNVNQFDLGINHRF